MKRWETKIYIAPSTVDRRTSSPSESMIKLLLAWPIFLVAVRQKISCFRARISSKMFGGFSIDLSVVPLLFSIPATRFSLPFSVVSEVFVCETWSMVRSSSSPSSGLLSSSVLKSLDSKSAAWYLSPAQ